MKLKATIAIAASAVALQANALVPFGAGAVTPALTVTTSGATAADKQFEAYIDAICEPGTLDTFEDAGDDATAFFCETESAADLAAKGLTVPANYPASTAVLFNKERGGSSTGIEPVSQNQSVTVVDVTAAACSLLTGSTNEWSCTATTTAPAFIGISDVEPELFSLVTNGSKTVGTFADVVPVNVQTFGVVATPDLRNALQAAQGLTVGSDEVADMPSLSSAVIANVFAGNIANWSTLVDGAGSPIAVNSNNVEVCVRSPGSGTQAQFNAFYMKDSCAFRGAGNGSYVGKTTLVDQEGIENNVEAPTIFGFPLPAPYAHRNKGSSDMGKCLTRLSVLNRTGLGVQSLEKVDEGRGDRNSFKYLAIDGVAPTLENVQAGLYRNWSQLSLQRNANGSAAGIALYDAFVEVAQAIDEVTIFNTSLQNDDAGSSNDNRNITSTFSYNGVSYTVDGFTAAGFRNTEILDGGVPANVGSLALAIGSTQPSAPWTAANPVMPFNKGTSDPSSCAVPTIDGSATVDVSYQN